jgi:hypothetical protein
MATNNSKIREKLIQGLELSYQRLLKEKIEKNQKLVISKDGKVVRVDPRKYQK